MEDRSEEIQLRCDKLPAPVIPRTRLQVWFIRVCSSIVLWTCLVQLVAVGELWHPRLLAGITNRISRVAQVHVEEVQSPPPLLPASEFMIPTPVNVGNRDFDQQFTRYLICFVLLPRAI